jgi:hypothetical protein
MTKRSRNAVLFENAPGGPRLLDMDEEVGTAAGETADGKEPSFKVLPKKKAREFLERERAGKPVLPADHPLLNTGLDKSQPLDGVIKAKGSHETIFDTLVNDMPRSIDGQARIRGMLFQARHFVLDPAACAFISNLASDDGLLDELREFALPPYDKLAITHHYGAEDQRTFPRASFDGRPAAFQSLTLWDHGVWKLFVAHEDGSSLATIPGWSTNVSGGMVINAEAMAQGSNPDDVARTLGSLAEHRKIIDAFFLLMIQTKAYQVVFGEARRTLHKGKQVKFFARSEIKINLTDPKELRRAFRTGTHASPRWHEVRRHFVHRGGDRACTHAWTALESEDGRQRWACDHCERRRTERYYPNGRGDAAKGFVRQTYSITAGD